MRSSWIRMGSKSKEECPFERQEARGSLVKSEPHAKVIRKWGQRSESGSYRLRLAKGWEQPTRAGTGARKQILPRIFQKELILLTF